MPTSVRIYDNANIPIDRSEILRYAGIGKEDASLSALIDECLGEVSSVITPKICYCPCCAEALPCGVRLGIFDAPGADLAKCLSPCASAVVFAATIGLGIDRLIAKYGILSPAKAHILQAIGAERVESLCDAFENDLRAGRLPEIEACATRPRFSPGYGDLPLSLQRDIFTALDCGKYIGITLNESLLMSPSKSVTAIIGIIK